VKRMTDEPKNDGNSSESELKSVQQELSCGAVLLTPDGRALLVKNRQGNIGFPKGHREAGETEEETALREIAEETGLSARLIGGFRQEYRYFPAPGVLKTAVYFLGVIEENASPEALPGEIGGVWLLPGKEARQALTYPADKSILDLALSWEKENLI